jgi:hypothetical protein
MPRKINATTVLDTINLQTEVPLDTESIDASDVVVPFQNLLDNDGYLYRRQQVILASLAELSRQSASFSLQSSVTSFLLEPARTYTFTGAIKVLKFGGLTADVTITAINAPAGVAVAVAPNPVSGTGDLTITTTSSIIAGTYDLILEGAAGGRLVDIRIPLTLVAATQPSTFDFTAPSSAAIDRASGATTTTFDLNVSRQGGFSNPVNFTADLPPGLSVSFAPAQVTGNAPMQRSASVATLTAGSTLPAGRYNVTLRAVSGSLVRTVALSVDVSQAAATGTPDFTLSLVYDSGDALSINGATLYVNRSGGYSGPVFLQAQQPYMGTDGPLITINNNLGIVRLDGNAARIAADGISQGWQGSGVAPSAGQSLSWASTFIIGQADEQQLRNSYAGPDALRRYVGVEVRRGNRSVG